MMSDISIAAIVIVILLAAGIPAGQRAAPNGTRWAGVHRFEDGITWVLLAIIALMALGGSFR